MNQACVNCRWWGDMYQPHWTKTYYGFCHRYPPVPLIDPHPESNNEEVTQFPKTPSYEWCGEFQQKGLA